MGNKKSTNKSNVAFEESMSKKQNTDVVEKKQKAMHFKQSKVHVIDFTPTVRVALDFGTDGLAISYLVNDKIMIQDSWKSNKYRDGVTQKTAVLIDSDGEVNQFGQDAIDYYLQLPSKQNDWMLFKEFVTDLYGM